MEKYDEFVEEQIKTANQELKEVKTAQELIDLVNSYYFDETGLGFPLYLIGKRSSWCLYSGTIIDDKNVDFLLSDGVSNRIVNVDNAYKYYRFSDRCR